jgi:hypothetical protein
LVGIAVVFGLSSTGCGKKSSQTGKTEETRKTEEKCPVWFKDSDKDGYTDGTTKVSCEKPSDEYVSSATAGDCNDNDPNINPARAEICDGKDNNCNGQIDEGFNVGQSCSVGVGECARTGQYVCKADGSGTQCNATPGTPTAEICDGKDNDCDGQIDEGIVCYFAKTIGGSDFDVALSIIQSSDGGYAVAGETSSFGAGGFDIYVVKLDSEGNVQWAKTIGGSSNDAALSIIQSSDGGYVVAGFTLSFGAGGFDIYVVKLDSEGNVQWAKTIGGSFYNLAWSIIQSSDGGYAVAGETLSFGAGDFDYYDLDLYVVKMDANLNVCFSQNITNYSVSSNVGSSYSPSPVVISQSPTVYSVSPTVASYASSVSDVCALAPAPHLNMCSANQDCGFSSAIATNREDVKSYGCSVGGVLSRFIIPASVPVIIYGRLRRKRKEKKGF